MSKETNEAALTWEGANVISARERFCHSPCGTRKVQLVKFFNRAEGQGGVISNIKKQGLMGALTARSQIVKTDDRRADRLREPLC
jgi:hypothetical protein